MNTTEFYNRYFEENTRFFWPEVKRCSHPAVMAGAIRHKIMSMAGMIKVTLGKEALGHWAWQFSILASELEHLHTKEMAHKEIERFRECARNGREYNRPKEDQTKVFNSAAWS